MNALLPVVIHNVPSVYPGHISNAANTPPHSIKCSINVSVKNIFHYFLKKINAKREKGSPFL
jgi:hypothetical protein